MGPWGRSALICVFNCGDATSVRRPTRRNGKLNSIMAEESRSPGAVSPNSPEATEYGGALFEAVANNDVTEMQRALAMMGGTPFCLTLTCSC